MDVIKCADWVIDLGPGGGKDGGHLVFAGTPEDLAKVKTSQTGKYLKENFNFSLTHFVRAHGSIQFQKQSFLKLHKTIK